MLPVRAEGHTLKGLLYPRLKIELSGSGMMEGFKPGWVDNIGDERAMFPIAGCSLVERPHHGQGVIFRSLDLEVRKEIVSSVGA